MTGLLVVQKAHCHVGLTADVLNAGLTSFSASRQGEARAEGHHCRELGIALYTRSRVFYCARHWFHLSNSEFYILTFSLGVAILEPMKRDYRKILHQWRQGVSS